MKIVTHIVSGFAIAFVIAQRIGKELTLSIVVGLHGALANVIIDMLGHRGRIRLPHTHSLIGATIVAILISIAMALGFCISVPIRSELAIVPILASCYIHLALDIVSRNGIYPLWPWVKKRISIANIRYDNPIANSIVIALSLLSLIYELYRALS